MLRRSFRFSDFSIHYKMTSKISNNQSFFPFALLLTMLLCFFRHTLQVFSVVLQQRRWRRRRQQRITTCPTESVYASITCATFAAEGIQILCFKHCLLKGTPSLVTFKVIINIKNSECIQELKWLLCWGFQKAAKASSLLYWMKFIVRGVTYIAYSSIQKTRLDRNMLQVMSQASDHQMLQVAHCLPFSMENRKKIFILGRSFAHYWAPRNNWLMCFLCASFPEISTKGQAIVRTCEKSKLRVTQIK